MNLYLLTQDIETGYDTYDSAVVAASGIEEARNTHPSNESYIYIDGEEHSIYSYRPKPVKEASGVWAPNSSDVEVELIGSTDREAGVILASFNAG